ncbi:hypothetical protein TWF694_008030 [Orbilia ellipsospora]|uniref:CBM1 domain-containing protein n=1 Tax=Orbilia ellipsospora TaxID=2528407 RepID=A0AAV9XGD8_9PEZI
MKTTLVALLSVGVELWVVPVAAETTAALAPLWGQCGGSEWFGPTVCVAGAYCHYDNDYHSRCIPIELSSGSLGINRQRIRRAKTTTKSTTTKSTKTTTTKSTTTTKRTTTPKTTITKSTTKLSTTTPTTTTTTTTTTTLTTTTAPATIAPAPLYGQCGGIGWPGPFGCVAGATCVYQNDYHYQCLPSSQYPPTTTSVFVEPTAPPGSLSIKNSCVNTTIQGSWFVGWCLTGVGDQRIQSSVWLDSLVGPVIGDLKWMHGYTVSSCTSCMLNNISELSCICPAPGQIPYASVINLEDHIANYNGFLLNDFNGPPVVPTVSKPGLIPTDLTWQYSTGNTSCWNQDYPDICPELTHTQCAAGLYSGQIKGPIDCEYNWVPAGDEGGYYYQGFKSFGFSTADSTAYSVKVWDNMDCTGTAVGSIVASQYSQCVGYNKKLIAWSVTPNWNADNWI